MKLTNKQFIDHLKSNLTSYHGYEIEEILNEIALSIEELIIQGTEVRIDNLGTFKTLTRKAHTGRHPITGEMIEIVEVNNLRFMPLKSLNIRINSGYNKRKEQSLTTHKELK